MSDLEHQIRDYYNAQELASEKVAAILARGREVAKGDVDGSASEEQIAEGKVIRSGWGRREVVWFALAAVVTLFATLASLWWGGGSRAQLGQLYSVVVTFFANEHGFALVSSDPEQLRRWALGAGAPSTFQIPEKLRGLPGKGCLKLDVAGKPVFLLCFMTVDASGAQDGQMVHLLVARRSDFNAAPAAVIPGSSGEWNFLSWERGELLYTIAAPAPLEKVRTYASWSQPKLHS